MPKTNLPLSPQEATRTILKNLPTRRMRDVLEKRFGLRGSKKLTLEAIGREYKITRERVRQIEADALKHLGKEDNLNEIKPLFASIREHLKNHGEVMAEHHLMATLGENKDKAHLGLLLDVCKDFHNLPETEHHYSRWTIDKTSAEKAEKSLKNVIVDLEKNGKAVSKEELNGLVEKNTKEITAVTPEPSIVETYLATSKMIGQNPYGEYGLVSWPTISPRGIKDKAYVALSKNSQPMHFLEIAQAINKAGWSKKKAHPQTVHNELIKDSRFVLVGRGLYALNGDISRGWCGMFW